MSDPSGSFDESNEAEGTISSHDLPSAVLDTWNGLFPDVALGTGYRKALAFVLAELGEDRTCSALEWTARPPEPMSAPIEHPPMYLEACVRNGTITREHFGPPAEVAS